MEKLTVCWQLVEQLKREIKVACVHAVLTLNAQMLELYWKTGNDPPATAASGEGWVLK